MNESLTDVNPQSILAFANAHAENYKTLGLFRVIEKRNKIERTQGKLKELRSQAKKDGVKANNPKTKTEVKKIKTELQALSANLEVEKDIAGESNVAGIVEDSIDKLNKICENDLEPFENLISNNNDNAKDSLDKTPQALAGASRYKPTTQDPVQNKAA